MILDSFPSKEEFTRLAESSTVIPVGVKILADTETPVSVLKRFERKSSDIFLFESADGGERWGRYSFMGTSARAIVTVYATDVVVREGFRQKRIPHGGNPMEVLRDLMKPYKLAELSELPRFSGGLVGYVAYEMAHFFENRIPNRLAPEQPLAEFMIPNNLIVFDNIAHTLAVVALAYTADGDTEKIYHNALTRVEEILADMKTSSSNSFDMSKTVVEQPAPLESAEEFMENVNRVKEYISESEVIQCVISRTFEGHAPDDLVGFYRMQRYINPSPYLFFFKCKGCTLIGSSPETLVRLDNRTACLRPIAGTRPRGETEQQDRKNADSLLQDEKERAEHLMLVDSARSELGRVSLPGTVQVTDLLIIERYSHVMHLVSNVVSELRDDCDAFELFKVGFPAGTLSGAPKIKAMEIIAEIEKTPRGPYGGACGYFSFDGNMDFAICIRTAIVEHKRLTFRAGAGIVADSDPAAEERETVNKIKAMVRSLDLLQRAQLYAGNTDLF